MRWTIEPGQAIVLLRRIRDGEDRVRDASDLCWAYMTEILSPEQLQARMSQLASLYAENSFTFSDPEVGRVTVLGFRDPPAAANEVADRLDALTRELRPEYQPDGVEQVTPLLVYAYLQGARLAALVRSEGFTDEVRYILHECRSSFQRLPDVEIQESGNEYLVLDALLLSFLSTLESEMSRIDGDYENALTRLATSLRAADSAWEMRIIGHGDLSSTPRQLTAAGTEHNWMVRWGGMNIWSRMRDPYRARELPPWLLNDETLGERAIACFEAIKSSRKPFNVEAVQTACKLIPEFWREVGLGSLDNIETDDEEIGWDSYWDRAQGWAAGQRSTELAELLNQAEDLRAKQRLKAYFFDEAGWNWLPSRAQRALVSADREWLDGTTGRVEALLNELRVATEEILVHHLLDPLFAWATSAAQPGKDLLELRRIKDSLAQGKETFLTSMLKVCGLDITRRFLRAQGLHLNDVEFATTTLPKSLRHLRTARNRAEHESGSAWTRNDMKKLYAEFLGVGMGGVLPRLSATLGALGRQGAGPSPAATSA